MDEMDEPLSPMTSCHVADFCSGKGMQGTVNVHLTTNRLLVNLKLFCF